VVDMTGVGARGVLPGKTEAPGLPPGLLWRGRLADRLTAASARPVTVVSAGPGWGKTMAAASWAVSGMAQHPVAWLGLDDGDDNPGSFWSNVVAALVASGVVRDRSPLRDQDRWARFVDADVDELFVHLADLPAPVALVIDDFQVITSDRVLA
jgi:LuxR family transcriptional regulator, maltose regulon positive regulatory protein